MSYASITLPAAQVRHVLTGPAGPHLDTLVAGLISAGVSVESITAGTTYRLDGSAELLDVLAAELAPVDGFSLLLEQAPADTVQMGSTVAPSHPFRRNVTIHSGTAAGASFVARAVDHRLAVESVGINRWSVTGRTSALVAWLAAIYVKTAEEVMALFNWDAASVAAEDAAHPAVSITLPPLHVAVTLPDRKTVSTFTRNADGDITQAIALETDTKP